MMSTERATVLLSFVLVFSFLSCSDKTSEETDQFPVLRNKYLGQRHPGTTPEIFAPGVVSTHKEHGSVAFSPDGNEFYFTRHEWTKRKATIMVSQYVDKRWTEPRVVPFSGKFWDDSPAFSHDGKRLYFHSGRPKEGFDEVNLWFVQKFHNGWGEPQKMSPPVNPGTGVSFSESGTLYFTSRREGGKGKGDIYRSSLVDGKYRAVDHLGEGINTEHSEYSPCIAPDESWLLFTRYVEKPRGVSIFVSFRTEDGTWTEAQNMGEIYDMFKESRFPSLSHDKKYLFFEAEVDDTTDLYWVGSKILEELRPDQ
ncbi:MAG: PD40 domain-containing protein [Gemmatimonadota bacterium]|nr:MAG: PD40 domain-containing protein [Gemmatimonadota bacterium]